MTLICARLSTYMGYDSRSIAFFTGCAAINGMLDDPNVPWGRFKYSGIGREFGRGSRRF